MKIPTCLAVLLATPLACTTTYVGDPELEPPRPVSESQCDADDTLPGCGVDRPMCQEANEYLCDPL